jgi:DNA-binding Lrp family transcriptional regulator
MQVRLDPATKQILVAFLASPKTPGEVSRIYGIPVATVWQRMRRLLDLGLVREVLVFVDSAGELRRYFEANLPIDTSEAEAVVEL